MDKNGCHFYIFNAKFNKQKPLVQKSAITLLFDIKSAVVVKRGKRTTVDKDVEEIRCILSYQGNCNI